MQSSYEYMNYLQVVQLLRRTPGGSVFGRRQQADSKSKRMRASVALVEVPNIFDLCSLCRRGSSMVRPLVKSRFWIFRANSSRSGPKPPPCSVTNTCCGPPISRVTLIASVGYLASRSANRISAIRYEADFCFATMADGGGHALHSRS